jgi:hypothetical protein
MAQFECPFVVGLIGVVTVGSPEGCPDQVYGLMQSCWAIEPTDRPIFDHLRQQFRALEEKLGLDMRRARSYRMPEFIADSTAVDEHLYVDFTSGSEIVPDLYQRSDIDDWFRPTFHKPWLANHWGVGGKRRIVQSNHIDLPTASSPDPGYLVIDEETHMV